MPIQPRDAEFARRWCETWGDPIEHAELAAIASPARLARDRAELAAVASLESLVALLERQAQELDDWSTERLRGEARSLRDHMDAWTAHLAAWTEPPELLEALRAEVEDDQLARGLRLRRLRLTALELAERSIPPRSAGPAKWGDPAFCAVCAGIADWLEARRRPGSPSLWRAVLECLQWYGHELDHLAGRGDDGRREDAVRQAAERHRAGRRKPGERVRRSSPIST